MPLVNLFGFVASQILQCAIRFIAVFGKHFAKDWRQMAVFAAHPRYFFDCGDIAIAGPARRA